MFPMYNPLASNCICGTLLSILKIDFINIAFFVSEAQPKLIEMTPETVEIEISENSWIKFVFRNLDSSEKKFLKKFQFF